MEVFILVNIVYLLPWIALIWLMHAIMFQNRLLIAASFIIVIAMCGVEAWILCTHFREIGQFFATLPQQSLEFLMVVCTVAVLMTVGGICLFFETIRMYFTLETVTSKTD